MLPLLSEHCLLQLAPDDFLCRRLIRQGIFSLQVRRNGQVRKNVFKKDEKTACNQSRPLLFLGRGPWALISPAGFSTRRGSWKVSGQGPPSGNSGMLSDFSRYDHLIFLSTITNGCFLLMRKQINLSSFSRPCGWVLSF